MLQYIRDHFTALYLTDADGNPTQHDLLDAEGVSLLTGSTPAFQVPNTFATNQWSVATGSNHAQINITISVLPANNGSPITAIQYRVGTGAWVTLPGATTGTYPVTMPATSTAYNISLRALNIVGPSAQSAAKTATSGAPAATAPAALGPTQWTLATGTEPASLNFNVLSLPADGGSPITVLEYRVGAGEWVALEGAGTGPRSITMPQASTAYTVTIRAVNSVGAGSPSAGKTATSAAPAQQAPTVTSAPSISGSTLGSILTRTVGAATGIPAPTRATVWMRNGTPIPSQTGNTLDTTGFAACDEITTRDVWTNSQGTATGTSEAVALSAQPKLTATLSTLTAGQQGSITFNVAPTSVTITQGQTVIPATRTGTTLTWTFAVPDDDTVNVGYIATLAGYESATGTADVLPAPPALIERNGTLVLRNVDLSSTTQTPLTVTEPADYAGSYSIVPTAFASGPVWLVAPAATRSGQTITARPGLPVWTEAQAPVTRLWRWLRGPTAQTATVIAGADEATYDIDAVADGGRSVYAQEGIEDAQGRIVWSAVSNGIAVASTAPATITVTPDGAVIARTRPRKSAAVAVTAQGAVITRAS